MRTEKQRVTIVAFLLMMLASAASVFAQEAPPKPPPAPRGEGDVVVFERHIGPPPSEGTRIELLPGRRHGPGDTFVFVSTEMSFGRKVVKNAPYSAQATTETVQVLGDGNRIVHKNTANVYRDSEGRTRHDQSLGSIGPWASAGQPQQTSFINDPVSRVHYVLDPRSRIARKLPLPPMPPPPPQRVGHDGAKVKHDMKVRVLAPSHAPPGGVTVISDEEIGSDIESDVENDTNDAVTGAALRVTRDKKTKDNLRRESLGKQRVEGVEAEGTRDTITIPAGEIGNEQPIQIVSERWYSPELQTMVLTKHTDPRFGETTFRLTNINRNEPARSLFEVPSDYSVKEGPQPHRVFRKKSSEEK